jgi:hypothetical protein
MDAANTVIQNVIFIFPPGLKFQAVLGALPVRDNLDRPV